MNVYSLFDRKLRQYGQLMTERNDFGMQRGLSDGLRVNPESLISKHPGDFDLYQVGSFDDESGLFGEEPAIPRLVCNLLDLVAIAPSLAKEG